MSWGCPVFVQACNIIIKRSSGQGMAPGQKGGQRRDLRVSWNCPSFVQLQGYQVVNQKNLLSNFCPAFLQCLLAKSKQDILAKRGQKWDKKDKNWTRGGQKQEFCEHNVVTNRTRTKWGQSRGKKWTGSGQILDKRRKVDKKWDTYKGNQHPDIHERSYIG